MSLQLAAKHLADKGRGPDTELVHMTKGEVHGLQALAKAHGGSLTINPHTGLPEAGFLSAILPAVTTAAATYFGGPTAGAATAALWGAKTYAETGSLTKGLITGLGAYGGSQLAAGMGPGAVETSALGGTGGAATSGAQAAAADAGLTSAAATPAGYTAGASYVPTGASTGMTWGGSSGLTQANVTGLAPTGVMDAGAAQGATASTLGGGTLGSQGVTSADYSALGRGIGSSPAMAETVSAPVSSSTPSNWDILKKNATMKNVGMAAAPVIMDAMTPKTPAGISSLPTATKDTDLGRRYTYVSGYDPKTGKYTGPDRYVPMSSTGAKALYGFADGGDVKEPVDVMPTTEGLSQGTFGNTPEANNAKIALHQAAMQGISGMAPMDTSSNLAQAANFSGYDTEPNIQKFIPASGGATAGGDSKGFIWDPATQIFSGGSDADYLGGGQWGQTSAEKAAAEKAAEAEKSKPLFGSGKPLIGAYDPNANSDNQVFDGNVTAGANFADGGMTYGNGDLQGDPNLMQVKTFDPVVRMRSGGSLADYLGPDQSANQIAEREYRQMVKDAPTKPKIADSEPMKKPKGLSDMPGLDKYAGLHETAGLYAAGGVSRLGDYSDGGRLLRGPGDGVSDSIPATIGNKRPARLADGEFVVPARIVSELGNGSTEAGARQLYAMMDRVQKARGKTVGKGKIAKNTKANRYLPA